MKRKSLFALLMALVILAGALPTAASAADDKPLVTEEKRVGEIFLKAVHKAAVGKRRGAQRGKGAQHAVFRFAHPFAFSNKKQLARAETKQRQEAYIYQYKRKTFFQVKTILYAQQDTKRPQHVIQKIIIALSAMAGKGFAPFPHGIL